MNVSLHSEWHADHQRSEQTQSSPPGFFFFSPRVRGLDRYAYDAWVWPAYECQCKNEQNQTINRTTLGSYKQGTKVNLEKSLKFGDAVGGHFVSGHIHTRGRIVEVELVGESKNILVEIEEKWIKYLNTSVIFLQD